MSGFEEDTREAPPKKKKYASFYNKEWEKEDLFKSWLKISSQGNEYAYCAVCTADLNIAKAGKSDILRHSKTVKHEKNKAKLRGQRSIQEMPNVKAQISVEKNAKEGEIRLAGFIVEHNLPLNIMEHLPNLIKNVCPDSDIAQKLACGRTKTTHIITEVLGKTNQEIIIEEMKNKYFSLIVDESTDKSSEKHLAVIVRFCRNIHQVVDYFFELFEIGIDGTTQKLYEILTNRMIQLNIPYKKNLIGFAADGANVMMGKHNSLASKLKADIPHLFIMKCICHSVHLVASNACLKLPRALEDLARDVYNYLKGSPKRIDQFKEFQAYLELKPHKLLQPSQTRWLSLEAVVSRLLEQYDALKLYFREAVFTDRIKAAENILAILEDPINKLYLQFMEFILEIFNILNKCMQSEKSNIHCIYKKVVSVIKTILECYVKEEFIPQNDYKNIDYKNPRKYLPIEEWYLGAKVGASLATMTIDQEIVKNFKLRCLEFYLESIKQLLQRFPPEGEMAVLKKMEFLEPGLVIDRNIKSIADVLAVFPNLVPPEKLQTVDTEWRLLRNTELKVNRSESVQNFWQIVSGMENGDGKMFPHLSDFVTNLMCLPHSSATVERLFSQINLTKTKLRNKLSTKVINGVLRTKNVLKITPVMHSIFRRI